MLPPDVTPEMSVPSHQNTLQMRLLKMHMNSHVPRRLIALNINEVMKEAKKRKRISGNNPHMEQTEENLASTNNAGHDQHVAITISTHALILEMPCQI